MNSPSIFEEARLSFSHHTKVDHDIWLYPNFIYYLSKKNEEDFTGDEIEIWTKYNKGDESWMPYKNTLYLEVSSSIFSI